MKLHEIIPYLLRRKLITSVSIVEGDLRIEEVARRNRSFKIMSRSGPCYLIKQGLDPRGAATVAHEAMMYRLLLQARGAGGPLARFLARCYGYDADEQVLVLELLRDSRDLRDYHMREGRFPRAVAAAIGEALGALHRLAPPADAPPRASLERPIPWALSIHRPSLEQLPDISAANVRLIELIQQQGELCQRLDELRRGWRAEALVHQDLKWDNLVLLGRPSARGAPRLKVVDWEFAGLGDPCWDAGAVFSKYLSFWLLSIPITGVDPPDRFVDLARYHLEDMQPAMRAYWEAYVRRMGLDAASAERWLQRAICYGAVDLIQTGFEHMQAAPYLTGNIVGLVQLSVNILRRPQAAIAQLLGIVPPALGGL